MKSEHLETENRSYRHHQFDDSRDEDSRFGWTRFYTAIADKLLTFRDKRTEIIEELNRIIERTGVTFPIQDTYADGTKGILKDICPFTVLASFSVDKNIEDRIKFAKELANWLDVIETVPRRFDGCPLINPLSSWFFSYEKDREADDIDILWEIFAQAIVLTNSEEIRSKNSFIRAYDKAANVGQVGWKLTIGLFWIRPWNFVTLDGYTRDFIEKKFDIKIPRDGPKNKPSGRDYLDLINKIEVQFQDDNTPLYSFPELSLEAWMPGSVIPPNDNQYSVNDILKDGCFLSKKQVEVALERLGSKRNLILQGPPGTGKTWLGKRLAYALIEKKAPTRIRVIQFHLSLSYEDFVRGWRPDGKGGLELKDGVFLQAIDAAKKERDRRFVVIIEEINRGNPAQIFGEMLTLLEKDKRRKEEAIELAYQDKERPNERVYIPSNLYIVGTMNIADRSLALVDLALRRRFAFITLKPMLNERWQNWCKKKGLDSDTIQKIREAMTELNDKIEKDRSLGKQFRIGHSYVTPEENVSDAKRWFQYIVETEIRPMLEEYWYDNPNQADDAVKKLLENFS